MRQQTEAAIAESDCVVFLIDGRAGLMPDDRHFAELVRRSGKPVILAANKVEGKQGMAGAYEAFSLGLGDPLAISAEHGEGMGELYEAILAQLDAKAEREAATRCRSRRATKPKPMSMFSRRG